MRGKRFNYLDDREHSGLYNDYWYNACIDEAVHVRYHVYSRSSGDKLITEVIHAWPCDGKCKDPIIDLPPEVEKAVAEWRAQQIAKGKLGRR